MDDSMYNLKDDHSCRRDGHPLDQDVVHEGYYCHVCKKSFGQMWEFNIFLSDEVRAMKERVAKDIYLTEVSEECSTPRPWMELTRPYKELYRREAAQVMGLVEDNNAQDKD